MTDFISTYGLAFIFVNVLIDQAGLPIPSIPTLIIAGALAADGKLSLPGLFIVAVAASLVAESAWYIAGKHYGNRVMKMLCRISLTPDTCVNQTQMTFERWGTKSLLIANFIPGFSIVAPPLAGATRIGWSQFLFYSTLGAIVWAGSGLIV